MVNWLCYNLHIDLELILYFRHVFWIIEVCKKIRLKFKFNGLTQKVKQLFVRVSMKHVIEFWSMDDFAYFMEDKLFSKSYYLKPIIQLILQSSCNKKFIFISFMSREFKISISPSLRRSNINYNISLKYGYFRSKETLIDKIKNKQTLDETGLRKQPPASHRKRTISVIDFSGIIEQRLKLPPLIKNKQQPLKIGQSVLIKDILNFPPSKTERKKLMKIPSDVISTLHERIAACRYIEHPKIRSLSNLSNFQKKLSQQKCEQITTRSKTKPKKRIHTQFQIQPWDIPLQPGSTITNFRHRQ